MRDYKSLAHTKWDCKYHVVFIPKYRKKVIYGDLRNHLGEMFHELAGYRECQIEEGHLMGDHVHQYYSEVCGIKRSGIYQGQEHYCGSAAI